MILALGEALAKPPTSTYSVCGHNHGCMTLARNIMRVKTERCPASCGFAIAITHPKAGLTPGSTRPSRPMSGLEFLRLRHERDWACLRLRPIRPLRARSHRRVRRALRAGLCRVRFAPGFNTGTMPAVRSRTHWFSSGRRRGDSSVGKFRLRAGPRRENRGGDNRIRHLNRQLSPHPPIIRERHPSAMEVSLHAQEYPRGRSIYKQCQERRRRICATEWQAIAERSWVAVSSTRE